MKKKTLSMLLFFTVLSLIAYKTFMPQPPTTLVFSGESETWRVEDVEISAGERLSFGEGTLNMKGQSEHLADYFKLSAHIELKWIGYDSDSRMHEYELESNNLPVLFKGDVLDIAEMDTGSSAPIVLTWLYRPVKMKHIKQVYIIVQWKSEQDHELKDEKIILTPRNV